MVLPPLLNDLPILLKNSPIVSNAFPNHLPTPLAKSTVASTMPLTKSRNFLLCLYRLTSATPSPITADTTATNIFAFNTAFSKAKAVLIPVIMPITDFKPTKTARAVPIALNAVVSAAKIAGCFFNFSNHPLMVLTLLAIPPKALVATPASLLITSVIFFLPTASIIFCQPFTTSASKLPKAPWNSAVPLANFFALSVEPS